MKLFADMPEIKELKSIKEWDEIKTGSMDSELIIFKYSPYCSISASVEEDFNHWVKSLSGDPQLNCIKVNVISERQLSQKIANDLKILHQSPQLIWLDKNHNIKWTASHYKITVKELSSRL